VPSSIISFFRFHSNQYQIIATIIIHLILALLIQKLMGPCLVQSNMSTLPRQAKAFEHKRQQTWPDHCSIRNRICCNGASGCHEHRQSTNSMQKHRLINRKHLIAVQTRSNNSLLHYFKPRATWEQNGDKLNKTA
jgi:hypothetical protein